MMLHVLINVNFNKYKGFAIGVMYTGCTISAFLFPRLLLFLKITYGFRGCMLIFGAITMHGTALVLFLKQSIVIQPQVHVKVLEDTSSNCAEPPARSRMSVIPKSMRHGFTVMKDITFYVIMTTYVVCNFAFGVFMATIVDFAVDRGATVVRLSTSCRCSPSRTP
ncbi:hypothetical protein HPB48_014718 [Haemaphysalis longicornis]|uniref:Monocarboxylate transporter n=1 Tax=Haemaphysalis longicornis TaxID=44386 RepID=A0A9J6GTZ6_HAELO|nr:hypothetical protein HPB48_014718 [Haemaphysalis longicornis]